MLHTRRFHQHGVFSGLPAALKPGLELALSGRDDKDGKVGLAGAANHIGDEGFVAGRVQNGEMLFLSFKVSSTDLYGFALFSLWKGKNISKGIVSM